jgi:hypothetical protein
MSGKRQLAPFREYSHHFRNLANLAGRDTEILRILYGTGNVDSHFLEACDQQRSFSRAHRPWNWRSSRPDEFARLPTSKRSTFVASANNNINIQCAPSGSFANFWHIEAEKERFVPNTLLSLSKKPLVFLNSSKDSQVPTYSKHSALAQEILTALDSAQVAL